MRKLAPLLSLVLVLGGCVSSKFMLKADPATLAPAAGGEATVVFGRTSSLATAVLYQIVSSEGRFVGECVSRSAFAVTLAPGKHTFYAWNPNDTGWAPVGGMVGGAAGAVAAGGLGGPTVTALAAELVAGRTYYVEVTSQGALVGVHPGTAAFEEAPLWLQEVTFFAVDEAAGQAALQAEDELPLVLEAGAAALAGYSAEERAERSLGPKDGR